MKQLLLLTALIATTSSFSQTRLIAHKSHSGNSVSYLSFAASGNFGEPPPVLKTVEKINDTTVVMTHQEWYDTNLVWSDTFYHHPIFSNPNMPVDSIKKTYYMQDVEFKKFDRQDAPAKSFPDNGTEMRKKSGHELPAGKRGGHSKKNTLWLLVIGSGIFLAGGIAPFVLRSSIFRFRRA